MEILQLLWSQLNSRLSTPPLNGLNLLHVTSLNRLELHFSIICQLPTPETPNSILCCNCHLFSLIFAELNSLLPIQSQSQSYFTTGSLPPISSSWRQAPWDSRPEIYFFQLNSCCNSPYVLCQFSSQSQSQSYVTTDGQSASLSWNKAPIWGLRPDSHYCRTIAGLLIWGLWWEDGSVFYNVQCTIYLHFACYYMNVCTQYIQGFCQCRHGVYLYV
jgi:hypothetical protein